MITPAAEPAMLIPNEEPEPDAAPEREIVPLLVVVETVEAPPVRLIP